MPNLPPEMEILLRPAALPDAPLIAQMANRIWRVHYPPIIGMEQVDYMLQKGYSEESLRQQMQNGQQFFLADAGGELVGYVSVTKKAEKEYFLNKFYMETDCQRKGYGRKIFAALLSRYPDMEVIRLQVNRMNFKTVNFYFSLGFTIELAKDFDIGGGYYMQDYVMVWRKE